MRWSRSEWAGKRVLVEHVSLKKIRVSIIALQMTGHIKHVSYSIRRHIGRHIGRHTKGAQRL